VHFVGDTVPCQAEGIGPERIGFDDFGASLQVVVVDGTNQLGLGEIQLVVAAVDEHAFGVKQRSHGSVAQNGGLLDPGKKVSRHILDQNTGSMGVVHLGFRSGGRSRCAAIP
jgi:hypothetical protein